MSLAVAGCGGTASDAAPQSAETSAPVLHNGSDVAFLQRMIAHNERGRAMVRLAARRAGRAEVRTLAAAVAATEADEVRLMTSWLRGWGEPVEGGASPDPTAHHGGLPATGAKEVEALKGASGKGFETAFLNLFVAHQHNAVRLARTESSKGAAPQVKAFAKRVGRSRTDQIRQMLDLLNA